MSDLIGFEVPKIDWTQGPDLVQRFRRFKQKCELLFEGPLKPRTDEQKCKYLLLWTGDYGLDLFNTWNLSEEQQKYLHEYWTRLEEHVKPQSNYILNRFYLRSLKQNNRPLDEFLTEAKLLIQNSGYPADLHDELLRDALVFGVDSSVIRKKCIAEGNNLTYRKAREIARTEEATKMQLQVMTDQDRQVNTLDKKDPNKSKTPPRRKPPKRRGGYKKGKDTEKPKLECGRCGGAPHDKPQKCPAINSKCYHCQKVGHYQHKCFKNKQAGVNALHDESSSAEDSDLEERVFLGTLTVEQCSDTNDHTSEINHIQSHRENTKVLTEMQLTASPHHRDTTPIVCKIDTGAEMNVISKRDYEKVVADPKQRQLGPPQCKITTYGGHNIKNLGSCQLYVHHKGDVRAVTFEVTEVPGPAMLGCKTCSELELVKFNCNLAQKRESKDTTNSPPSDQQSNKPCAPLTKKKLLDDYRDRFDGLGEFHMKPYHIALEPGAEPVIHPPRSVPVHLRELYKQEINKMLELGVITEVNTPTDWVNSIVLSESTNDKGEITKLRVCLDPRDLNKWIKREQHYTKTVDEVVTQLNDAKFFTLVDAKKGYWHVPLDEASSYLTTFSTPFGRFRFLRLPFGLTVAQDVFQKQLDSALEGLSGVTGIADDTFVFGSTENEHDRNLADLMERARQKGIVFNKEKVQFKCKEVQFFGHTWTPQGVKPDNGKVAAIQNMQPPEDVKSLQSFLGLVNYLTRYSAYLATITSPLRELTKKDVAYVWGPEHDRAFDAVKKEVSSLGVLRYFDPRAETVIQADASLKGLGAVLLQHGQPVCYASKALTETEQRYSNIERETLALVWGLERFHYFIYGKRCTVNTDHKPLEAIFKKKLSSCPARLQRFVLRALKYDIEVKYVKGTEVPIADALSRVSPLPVPANGELPQLDIHFVTRTLPASPTRLQQIREETTNDPTLSTLRDAIYKGWPDKREKCPVVLHEYWNFREELTIEDGIILKGDRIVVPTSLRKEILSIIHQGHLGQEKCLLRARTSVFWPGLTKDVVNLAKECDPCQRHQNKQQKQPILQPEPPNYPWQRLNSDLFEFKGHQYLLVSDQYSKFPVIRKLSSTTSQAIITHLKSIFAEHGIPAQLVSDNGPQYSAKEFQDFTESYGIEHVTSSPHYPQANGSSERMVQTVKNILTKCDEEGGDPYLALLSYRATPISHHLDSPAQLLTKRKFKTLLPMSNRASCTADSGDVKEQLKKQQEYYGQYYNQKAGPALKPLHPGQPVRVLDHQTQTWQPGTVLRAAKEPRSYIVKNDTTEGVYRRTRSHLRPDTARFRTHNPPPADVPVQIMPAASPSSNHSPANTVDQLPGDSTVPAPPTGILPPPGSSGGYMTRSGRTVKPPERLNI